MEVTPYPVSMYGAGFDTGSLMDSRFRGNDILSRINNDNLPTQIAEEPLFSSKAYMHSALHFLIFILHFTAYTSFCRIG